ncbi:UvrD-helicase domain-containing protein [Pseudomonas marginalis]|uniref:UvrD-helicase domain-containing protein n=1 Tax=Pseudomonas marginalis TaxID=298 RepID=UPI0011B50621|nr:UvrD-helicase domain-containing protein [Pseudomonas marginalis]KAA8553766.1 ATP-dependent helicase/nuclease subunit A [Pseudomonas marginalis]TWR73193.1 RNA helicase [Pseudomonas marginalis]
MPNVLCMAGAGSGKTHKIITEAIAEIRRGGKVLVVTYTTSNQQELRHRFLTEFGQHSSRFVVKGLFTFYLEDMIRPYQQAYYQKRIEAFFFNASNPHLKPKTKFTLPGRKEQLDDKSFNPNHFLTQCHTKAHTGFLAKLSARLMKTTKHAAALRLGEIYSQVYFDEVQDLVGWDYDVLKGLNKAMKSPITCVGDFRQTVYETTFGHKAPQTSDEKIAAFKAMGFTEEALVLNWRSLQSICDIADEVHKGAYKATKSAVVDVPPAFIHHLGAFIVKQSDVTDYVTRYDPMVLRWSVTSGRSFIPSYARCYNFGASKGLGFDRTLILPTDSQIDFVLSGAKPFPKKAETAQNKLYVAITRARYSLGFIVPDNQADGLRFPLWTKAMA